MSSSSDRQPWGLMAEFDTADALLAAARRVHEAGYQQAEAYSPFPIDGLAEAIGFARSRVPLATLLGALAGGAGGYFMQWYSAVIDYPLDIGGRPLHSWPMFVPVAFELAVLGGALAAVLAMLIGSGLPRLRHPVFDAPDFELATRNRFFLVLRADDPALRRRSSGTAARRTAAVASCRGAAMLTRQAICQLLAALLTALAVLALGGCERQMRDMYEQPRYDPGEASPLFANGMADRPPPPGSVPMAAGVLAMTSSGRRGIDLVESREAAERATTPPAPTAALLQRGRERYDIFCLPCHSPLGDGDGPVVRRGFPRPPSYHQQRLRAAPDRHFYDVISRGYGVMYPYADRVAAEDRWAIVAYIRALQLSRHIPLAQLPPALQARIESMPPLAGPPAAAASEPAR